MLRREAKPELQLDPRLEKRTAPTGEVYYYNARDRLFLRHPRQYDSVQGGILAETMGLGKTVICLALVLATKGHTARIPCQYAAYNPKRSSVGTLKDMAAATLARSPIPWRPYFDRKRDLDGLEMIECVKALESQDPLYEIPPEVLRSHRYSTITSPSDFMRLSSTTLIVVPKNLVHQWKAEIAKHLQPDALRVLILEDRRKPVPPARELAQYDLVLFSRPRFENENKNTAEIYESPLKRLHWSRIIIDEGHGISSGSSNAAVVAERLVRAERRWVVSGTPAKDLMGVEVELNAMTNGVDPSLRERSLEQRKSFNIYQEQSSGAIKAIGQLASRFLKAQPWAASQSLLQLRDAANWEDYVYRHESLTMKTYSGFSTCFRRTLENLVVKTRPEDVEKDLELPPLHRTIVRLEPCFFDKITANLFVLQILSNAVTSERQDMDYLFHKNNQQHLHRLISSLRQSGFYWTSMDQEHVQKSIDVTRRYLSKDGISCSDEDQRLVEETTQAATLAMDDPTWRAVTQTSEMGVSIEHWPEDSVQAWSFAGSGDHRAMGLTHALWAQRFLNEHLSAEDPTEGFEAKANEIMTVLATHKVVDKQQEVFIPNISEAAPPSTPSKKAKSSKTAQSRVTPSRAFADGAARQPTEANSDANPSTSSTITPSKDTKRKSVSGASEKSPNKSKKRRISAASNDIELSPESDLGSAVITGTTSSKLTYLLNRILELHKDEKILIFYDADFIAYYLATAMDLFHIKYLMYSSGTSNERRGKLLVLFNEDTSQRIMLMDIKQAAHGLNVSTASRVFFVNPVCRPNIEAQAIKRAHRIGQTRPVYVETLVLSGTVEEAMHERATRMTSHEHLQAKTLEDDLGVARIIQSARVLPISEEELRPEKQMAKLAVPQQIFGRPGRGGESRLEKEVFGTDDEDNGSTTSKKRGKGKGRKKVTIKEEPVDEPIPWISNQDADWAPQAAQSSIFGGT